MATLENLKNYTVRDLGQMARKFGIDGWSSMRKDRLIRVLVRAAKTRNAKRPKVAPTKSRRAKLSAKKSSPARIEVRAKSAKIKSAKLASSKNGTAKSGVTKVNGAKVISDRSGRHKAAPINTLRNGQRRAPQPSAAKSGPAKVATLKAPSVKAPSVKAPSVKAPPSLKANTLKSNSLRAAAGKAATKPAEPRPTTKPVAGGSESRSGMMAGRAGSVPKNAAPKKLSPPTSPAVARKIREASAQREREKDLATQHLVPNQRRQKSGGIGKDRLVLLVRDPYWLHACWDLSRHSVERARAAMAEHWHTARPVLRLIEVDDRNTTSTAERVARDIEIHGGVKNWYIDVKEPPQSHRVDLGYIYGDNKFYSLARSNSVTTPRPGSSDAIDRNWSDVAENYEKIYALSGGYREDTTDVELKELFEERLRRPMGSPLITRFGAGAERAMARDHDFLLDVDAEMIIFGTTKPDAHVSLGGDPVKLRSDGTFTVRVSMPDRRQVLPVVASSADGVEQRTVVLAVERNTKVMEPMIREGNE